MRIANDVSEDIRCLSCKVSRENILDIGSRRLHILLRRNAVVVNHKRVQRVYREMGLSVKRNQSKRLMRVLPPRPALAAPRQQWYIDFANERDCVGTKAAPA